MTDRAALARFREQVKNDDGPFLHQANADEIQERLQEINKSFTHPLVITGHPGIWHDRLPNSQIIGDGDILDVSIGAHDLVVHAMSLHWANDPVGQLVQCRRALKPDGLLIATLFGGQTLNELRSALAHAEAQLSGGLSPRVAPMGDVRDLGALLQRAGLALPVADTTTVTVSYSDIYALMRDLRGMGETNALAQRSRRFSARQLFEQAARVYSENFGMTDGRIPATFEVVTLTGWAPSETQPQPLRPGSAKTRLADALGAIETSLNRSDH